MGSSKSEGQQVSAAAPPHAGADGKPSDVPPVGPKPSGAAMTPQPAGGSSQLPPPSQAQHAQQPAAPPRQPVVVGLALKKEKRQKHISDKLVQLAAEAGIMLRFIDKEVPLEEQGRFDAVLQKVRKPEWEAALAAYAAAHPEVKVFDPPAATYPLRHRGTMVSFLDGDGWLFQEPAALVEGGRPPLRCRCNVPTNTTLAEGTSYEAAARQLEAAGLRYPLLAKPLWADGREGSHALAVVHSPRGLQRLVAGEARHLQLPVLLQQYVDHGGCLFKVYVLGDISVRVKRNSLHLPQWSCAAQQQTAASSLGQQQQQQQQQQGVGGGSSALCAPPQPLPDLELLDRVSAYPASKSWGKADTAPKGHGVPSPPAWLLQALAQRLRQETGLTLFNFDVIVPMHLHRRRCAAQQQSSSAELPRLAGTAGGDVAGSSPVPAQNGSLAAALGEEPAVLDLAQAQAEAAAAAAASAPAGGQRSQQQAQQAASPGSQEQQRVAEQEQPAAHLPGQQMEQSEEGEELLYHLIDINYFPGYEKMPNYEDYMVQFLQSIAQPQAGQPPPLQQPRAGQQPPLQQEQPQQQPQGMAAAQEQ